jgi:hypothetical protein
MDRIATNIIYELWITFAEKLFERIVEVTQLTDEQADALRHVVLRPNDFDVVIDEEGAEN